MPRSDPPPSPDLAHISAASWAKAQTRFAAIQPLLNGPVSKEIAKEYAATIGVHVSTLYRWLERYRTSEQITALVPDCPGVRRGDTRLPRAVEEIVAATLDEVYLNRQRPSVPYVAMDILARCKAADVAPPHRNTIRRRIAQLPAPEMAQRRYEAEASKLVLSPRS